MTDNPPLYLVQRVSPRTGSWVKGVYTKLPKAISSTGKRRPDFHVNPNGFYVCELAKDTPDVGYWRIIPLVPNVTIKYGKA